MESIKYWPTAPEHEVYLKVVNLPSVTPLGKKMISLFSAGIRESSVAYLDPSD